METTSSTSKGRCYQENCISWKKSVIEGKRDSTEQSFSNEKREHADNLGEIKGSDVPHSRMVYQGNFTPSPPKSDQASFLIRKI